MSELMKLPWISERKYAAIDMKLDENILSRGEFDKAIGGKRHWRDEAAAAT